MFHHECGSGRIVPPLRPVCAGTCSHVYSQLECCLITVFILLIIQEQTCCLSVVHRNDWPGSLFSHSGLSRVQSALRTGKQQPPL